VETGLERALSHVDENRGFMTYFQSDKPPALGLAMSLFLVFFDDMGTRFNFLWVFFWRRNVVWSIGRSCKRTKQKHIDKGAKMAKD